MKMQPELPNMLFPAHLGIYRLKHRKKVLCKTLEEFVKSSDIKHRRVRLTRVGERVVSSVFDMHGGRFETAIMCPDESITIIARAYTHRGALRLHREVVAQVKAGKIT